MADYLPKAEQLDTMNQRLAELNEHLQKREDFTAAMAKLDSATQKAESLKDGADGFSPVATVTQTSTGADISITDKNGTTSASITNGSDANVTKENVVSALGYTPLESAPVTSVNGKTGAVELAASDVGAISDSDGSVQNAHLADASVTTDKLAEGERMTSANITNALGYEPEKVSGEWELLNEITTTADNTGTVYITRNSDGNGINATSLLLIVTAPDSISGMLSCGIWARFISLADTEETVYFWNGLTTRNYPGKKYAVLHGTVVEATSVQFTTGGSASSATNFGLNAKVLTGFSIGGANIPCGTKLTVYGIRA